MKHITRRICSLILAVMLVVSLGIGAAAQTLDDGYEFEGLGEKTAEQLVNPGRYEITVSVPGAVASEEYSEVIVMVDASSSQGANLEKLKTMLVNLAKDILHNDGSTRLTLMGFGMGPRNVGSFYNAETLESYLAGVTQADLRQGVSATNCEGALEFVREYIDQSEKLHKTYVIFTSDGMTNMDETGFALSTWLDHPEWYMSGATAPVIASYAAGGQADLLLTDGTILTPTAQLYPEESIALALARNTYGLGSEEYRALVDDLYAKITATEESGIAFVNALWADVFALSGMTYADDVLYSTSELEKAFLVYFDGIATNSFLCTIHGMKNASFYPDWYNLGTWGARAAAEADRLANHEKVLELYMMDFANKVNTWMNPASTTANHVTSGKITYHTATNFGAAVDKIESLSEEMFTTVYNNATVVDPMSKWVILDPSSIRIYEDDLLIYQYGQGWLYADRQPAAEPITLTQGEDGRYQITWRIKDGHLLYSDRYFLKYCVDVDETVDGFEYGKMYPANDPTSVEYEDANGNPQVVPVDVPEVTQLPDPDDFDEGDKGLRIYKSSSKDRTPIAGIVFDIFRVVPEEGDVLNPNPAEEEYSKYATAENLVATLTTDGNGYASLNMTEKGLEDGFYLVVERPSDKVVAPVAPFYISVPMLNPETGKPMELINIYPKNEPIEPTEPPKPPVIPEEPEPSETGRVTILKHSEAGEEIVLEGATFQMYRLAAEGEVPTLTTVYNGAEIGLVPLMVGGETVTFTTDANGVATSPELPYGLYFVVETQAPDGYYLLETPVPVFVAGSTHELGNAVKIANTAGVQLPETGGPGTVMFTVMGLLLCTAAVVLLVTKRRMAR